MICGFNFEWFRLSRGGTGLSTSSSERAEAEVAVEQAWAELAGVEREQEAARAERERVERQLEQVRLRGAQLEQVRSSTLLVFTLNTHLICVSLIT